MTQEANIKEMRAELESLGGSIVTFEEVPADIEEQFLRRILRRPEYIVVERSSRLMES